MSDTTSKFLSYDGLKHFIEKYIGKKDISSISDGTLSGAVDFLNGRIVTITSAEYGALTDEQKNNGTYYYITDGVMSGAIIAGDNTIGLVKPDGTTTIVDKEGALSISDTLLTTINNKVTAEEGKGLSENDYDDAAAAEVAKIQNKADKSTTLSGYGIIDAVNIDDYKAATTSTLGIIKPDGDTITVDEDGTAHGALRSWSGTSAEWEALDKTTIADGTQINITDDEESVNVINDGSATVLSFTQEEWLNYDKTDLNDGDEIIITDDIASTNGILRSVEECVNNTSAITIAGPETISELNSNLTTLNAKEDNTELILTNTWDVSDLYSATTEYTQGTLCVYNNKLWGCLTDCTGETPEEGTYWTQISLRSLNTKFHYNENGYVDGYYTGADTVRNFNFVDSYSVSSVAGAKSDTIYYYFKNTDGTSRKITLCTLNSSGAYSTTFLVFGQTPIRFYSSVRSFYKDIDLSTAAGTAISVKPTYMKVFASTPSNITWSLSANGATYTSAKLSFTNCTKVMINGSSYDGGGNYTHTFSTPTSGTAYVYCTCSCSTANDPDAGLLYITTCTNYYYINGSAVKTVTAATKVSSSGYTTNTMTLYDLWAW